MLLRDTVHQTCRVMWAAAGLTADPDIIWYIQPSTPPWSLQGHGHGPEWAIHIPSVPRQSAFPFLRYVYFKIWPWFASFLFHVNCLPPDHPHPQHPPPPHPHPHPHPRPRPRPRPTPTPTPPRPILSRETSIEKFDFEISDSINGSQTPKVQYCSRVSTRTAHGGGCDRNEYKASSYPSSKWLNYRGRGFGFALVLPGVWVPTFTECGVCHGSRERGQLISGVRGGVWNTRTSMAIPTKAAFHLKPPTTRKVVQQLVQIRRKKTLRILISGPCDGNGCWGPSEESPHKGSEIQRLFHVMTSSWGRYVNNIGRSLFLYSPDYDQLITCHHLLPTSFIHDYDQLITCHHLLPTSFIHDYDQLITCHHLLPTSFIHVWQVLTRRSRSDTCQTRLPLQFSSLYFCKFRNVSNDDINGYAFIDPSITLRFDVKQQVPELKIPSTWFNQLRLFVIFRWYTTQIKT